MKPKQKATQVIKDLDFSEDGCAVSLVGPSVGGAANNYKVLTVKSASKISDEFIKKASTVKVTMEMTDYLSKFYGLWYDEAEVLARALGYTTAEMEYTAANPDNSDTWYEDYITEKVNSIEIMKSLYQAENMADVLAELTGPQYLGLIQDQAMLEKSFRKIERINKAAEKAGKESKPTGKDTSESEVKEKEGQAPVVKQTKETNMDEIVELQKSLNEQKEMLTKALEQVKALESEKQEQVVKSKTAKISEFVKDAGHAAAITKAALALEDGKDFDEFVKAVEAIAKAVDKSDLFIEKGLQVDNAEAKNETNHVEKLLKAKYAAK